MQLKISEKQLASIKSTYKEVARYRHTYQTQEAFRLELTKKWDEVLENVGTALNGDNFSRLVAEHEISHGHEFDWEIIKPYIVGRNLINKTLTIPQFYGVYSINTGSPEGFEGVLNLCDGYLCAAEMDQETPELKEHLNFPALWVVTQFLTNTAPLIPAEVKPLLEEFLEFVGSLPTKVFIDTLDLLILWNADAKQVYLDYIAQQIESGIFKDCILETESPDTYAISFDVDTFWEFLGNLAREESEE